MHENLARESSAQSAAPARPARADKGLIRWQTRMLPFMQAIVVALMIFFFVATCLQLLYLQQRIGQAPQVPLSQVLPEASADGDFSPQERIELAQFRATVALELNTLERRHHQANVVLMSQLWIRYLGFVTGMMMTLIGAVFVLGKLQERFSEIRASVGGAEGTLRSSSPGLVLVVLGTALMMVTIVIRHELSVTDSPVYTRVWSIAPGVGSPPVPPPLDPKRPTDK